MLCALKENKHFMISWSTKKKLCVKCVDESCKWYVCAVMKPNFHGLWQVTVYVGPHTCIPIGLQNDGRMMNSNFIASDILKKLSEDHTTSIKHLKSMMESKYDGHKPSYYKVWDAKQKVIEKIFGNQEESYQRLQKLLLTYDDQDSDTRMFYHTMPTNVDDTRFLHYVFWSFGPCIDGFKYCKPVISIFGTHLYGKSQREQKKLKRLLELDISPCHSKYRLINDLVVASILRYQCDQGARSLVPHRPKDPYYKECYYEII